MPTYAYGCDNCGVRFDRYQSYDDAPLTECPECGEDALRKLFTPIGVVFKGSGFYSTDHRSPSGQGSSRRSEESGSTGKDGSRRSEESGSEPKDSSRRSEESGSEPKDGSDKAAAAKPAKEAKPASPPDRD